MEAKKIRRGRQCKPKNTIQAFPSINENISKFDIESPIEMEIDENPRGVRKSERLRAKSLLMKQNPTEFTKVSPEKKGSRKPRRSKSLNISKSQDIPVQPEEKKSSIKRRRSIHRPNTKEDETSESIFQSDQCPCELPLTENVQIEQLQESINDLESDPLNENDLFHQESSKQDTYENKLAFDDDWSNYPIEDECDIVFEEDPEPSEKILPPKEDWSSFPIEDECEIVFEELSDSGPSEKKQRTGSLIDEIFNMFGSDSDEDGDEVENDTQNIFDKTLYNQEDVNQHEENIPDDRDWSGDFDSNFDVTEQLKKVPTKSCLRQKPRSIPPNLLNTYKYFDANNRMIYVISGYSNSTFIRRVIIYLQIIRGSFDMITVQGLLPGVNLEANLYANFQSISDLFRNELIPMLTYSIYNKDLTPYFHELQVQLQDTIPTFLSYSILDSEVYRFTKAKNIFVYSDDAEDQRVDAVERTKVSKFVENLYLFSSTLIHGVFHKKIHFSVLQEMFSLFQLGFHQMAESVLSTD